MSLRRSICIARKTRQLRTRERRTGKTRRTRRREGRLSRRMMVVAQLEQKGSGAENAKGS